MIDTQKGMPFGHEKKGILPSVTRKELESTILNEISQTDNDKLRMVSVVCEIYK